MKMTLTPQQQKAYGVDQGDILVSAGAGSGKTRVLVERFVRLICEGKAEIDEILTVTFTQKAANEMKERIWNRLEEENRTKELERFSLASIGTIHSFCARILAENKLQIPIDPNYQVMESVLQYQLLEETLFEIMESVFQEEPSSLSLIFQEYGFNSLLSSVVGAYWKLRSLGLTPEQFDLHWESDLSEEETSEKVDLNASWEELTLHQRKKWEKEKKKQIENTLKLAFEFKAERAKKDFVLLLNQVWKKMESKKRTLSFLDHDDLQLLTLKLLKENRSFREQIQKKYRYVMIDEFQDTNPLQVQILDLICGKGNAYCVGDKKQAIYGFRYAEIESFEKKEEGALLLNDNFRSQKPILDFVNSFFEKMWDPQSQNSSLNVMVEKGTRSSGVEIALVDQADSEEVISIAEGREREAIWIAQKILQLLKQGFRLGEIVLLFRSTTALSVYLEALKGFEIPFYLVSGRGFYSQQEIYDAVNYLKVVSDPDQEIPLAALLRSPFVALSDETLYWLTQKKREEKVSLWALLQEVDTIEQLSVKEREKIEEVCSLLKEHQRTQSLFSFVQLLERGLKTFGYGTKSTFFQESDQRLANLQKLMHQIETFEKSFPSASLEELLLYLDRLEKSDGKEQEESLAEEQGDVVRVMTIHQSKGLEFPVVFVPDLGREDVSQKGDFRFSSKGEFSLKVLNPVTQQKEMPYFFEKLHQENKKKDWEEKKRLLYVAMTRAEEQLYLVGTAKFGKKSKTALEGQTWADWLRVQLKLDTEAPTLSSGTTFTPLSGTVLNNSFSPNKLEKVRPLSGEREKEAKRGRTLWNPHSDSELSRTVPKVAVSGVVRMEQCPYQYYLLDLLGWRPWGEKEEEDLGRSSQQRFSSRHLGTVVHRVLEKVEWARFQESVEEQFDSLFPHLSTKEKKNGMELAQTLKEASLFNQIQSAKSVYRERSFSLSFEEVILEGAIDLLLISSDGEALVIDYKTGGEKEGYSFQLQLYLWAVQRLFPEIKKISGGLFYLKTGKFVPVSALEKEEFESQLNSLIQKLKKDHFEATPSSSVCSNCSARSICSSAAL